MINTIINHLAKHDRFWRQMVCRAGKPSISPHVKFLCDQKMLCYGVSASAFLDYFQMGESTLRPCLSKITQGTVKCNALTNVYLWRLAKLEARNIVRLHKRVQKIPGMMGLLDVTKVHWKNCPTAWNG